MHLNDTDFIAALPQWGYPTEFHYQLPDNEHVTQLLHLWDLDDATIEWARNNTEEFLDHVTNEYEGTITST